MPEKTKEHILPTPQKADLFAQKLRDLGAPVVPVLYMSHAGTLDASTMTNASMDAIGPHCIVAEGVGERDMRDYSSVTGVVGVGAAAAAQPVAARAVRWNDIWLHRIRRSIMLCDFRPEESRDVVDLATAPAALPFGNAAAVYKGSRYVYSDHILQTLRKAS
jgi:hypothetical protein